MFIGLLSCLATALHVVATDRDLEPSKKTGRATIVVGNPAIRRGAGRHNPQPGDPSRRTRGFASPRYRGFALHLADGAMTIARVEPVKGFVLSLIKRLAIT
jgi:hypothetical protein